VRRTPSNFEKPAAKPAPAPIPLTTRKSPSGGFTVGEIRSPKVMRPTPIRGAMGAARGPTVHVQEEPATLSLDTAVPTPAAPRVAAPVAVAPVAVAPAPISARQAPAPARANAHPLAQAQARVNVSANATVNANAKANVSPNAHPAANPGAAANAGGSSSANNTSARKSGRTPVPHAPTFSALEADFFAREADLYKNEGGDSFDDLERGGEANAASRAPRRATPRGGSRAKKR
jgi:hypothetical protein